MSQPGTGLDQSLVDSVPREALEGQVVISPT